MLNYSLLDWPLASQKNWGLCLTSSRKCWQICVYDVLTMYWKHDRPENQWRTDTDLWPNPSHSSLKAGETEQMTTANLTSHSKELPYGCFSWMNFGHIPGLTDQSWLKKPDCIGLPFLPSATAGSVLPHKGHVPSSGCWQHGLAGAVRSWLALCSQEGGSWAWCPPQVSLPSPSAAEGCTDKGTPRCDGAVLSDPSKSSGRQPWGCACRGTAEVCQHPSMDTGLWSTWPCCCWDVSLPPPGMQSWLKTLFSMKDTLLGSNDLMLAVKALLPAKPGNCIRSHIYGIPVLPRPWQPLIQHSIKMQWSCVLLGPLPIQLSFCVLWSLSQ